MAAAAPTASANRRICLLSTYFPINLWDVMLVIVVSISATILAYLPKPRWKALVISLPIPFTLMVLAAGRPLDATNVMGLFLLLLFHHSARLLHQRFRIPIILSIILSALGYCVLGSVSAYLLPKTDAAFWVTWSFVFLLGSYLILSQSDQTEPEYRTQLPVWIKLPITVGVVILLILIRNILQGVASVFPMVGVIAVYESRYCLWTLSRQIPVVMVSIGTMMAATYLIQQHSGLPIALLIGWCVFLVVFGLITMWMRARTPDLTQ
jgi:hypothetical protein